MPVTEPSFRISTFCHAGGCVGVAIRPDGVAVKSTRVTDSPVLSFSATEWITFVGGVRKDELDSRGDS